MNKTVTYPKLALALIAIALFAFLPSAIEASPPTPIMDGTILRWQRDITFPEVPTRYDVRIECSEDCESSDTSTIEIAGTEAMDYSYPVTWTHNDRVLRITIFAFHNFGILSSYPTVTYTNPNYIPPPGAPNLGTSGRKITASWTPYPGTDFYSVRVCGNDLCTPYTGINPMTYTNSIVLEEFFPEHQTATITVFAHAPSTYAVLYAYPPAVIANPNFGNHYTTIIPQPTPQQPTASGQTSSTPETISDEVDPIVNGGHTEETYGQEDSDGLSQNTLSQVDELRNFPSAPQKQLPAALHLASVTLHIVLFVILNLLGFIILSAVMRWPSLYIKNAGKALIISTAVLVLIYFTIWLTNSL